MNLLKNYQNALQAIYDHVGFVEDWVIYPIDDCTEKYWAINEEDKEVHFADSIKEFREETGNFYVEELYTQRFYKKHIYSGELFTLVFCDSQTDGMKWFRIFDNQEKLNFVSGKTEH